MPVGLFLGKDFRANMDWSIVCWNMWGSDNCSSLHELRDQESGYANPARNPKLRNSCI